MGNQIHVTGLDVFDPVAAGLVLMEEIRRLHHDRFECLSHKGNYLNGRLPGVTDCRMHEFDERESSRRAGPRGKESRKETKRSGLYCREKKAVKEAVSG